MPQRGRVEDYVGSERQGHVCDGGRDGSSEGASVDAEVCGVDVKEAHHGEEQVTAPLDRAPTYWEVMAACTRAREEIERTWPEWKKAWSRALDSRR